ncbi:hypothetical protein Q31a_51790 [Aureliella helgolandensis]|uniref:Uncharacterized protein n=1 Tax=Aureliella helgolandensis TaxID=2527968 RepID=A0A518GE11_9BACT|nr:hypothetical protein Q31a_51790 [Aureliella helgolandensis]
MWWGLLGHRAGAWGQLVVFFRAWECWEARGLGSHFVWSAVVWLRGKKATTSRSSPNVECDDLSSLWSGDLVGGC